MKIYHASLILIAMGALVTVGAAQGPGGGRMGGPGMGGPRGKPGEREKKMLAQLNLTPAQKKKTDFLIDEEVAKRMKLRPAGSVGRPSPDQMKNMRALREEYMGKIKKVLTAGQVKKLDDMEKAMRARFGGGRGPGGPGGPGGAVPPPPHP